MKKMETDKKLNQTLISMCILFIFCMSIHMIIDNTQNHYDSAQYWKWGKACGWNIKNMSNGFRGYLLPYIFSMCYKFGMLFNSEMLGYRIFSSLIFSFTFSFLFQGIVKILGMKIEEKKTLFYGCINGILFVIFFKGLLIYTLSDFYAFSLFLTSIILLHNILIDKDKILVRSMKSILLGICLYGAYNIRTIYLFNMIIVIVVLIIWKCFAREKNQLLNILICCFGGIQFCALPQRILNHNLMETYSWKVPTEGLMLKQLSWGVRVQRYSTYIGDKMNYSEPGMTYVDKIGKFILEQENIYYFESYQQFFKIVFKYFIDFIGIYTRHFLNILYPFYPNQYVKNITKDKSLLLILFYTILFVSLFYFVYNIKKKNINLLWMILILIPSICILPGAVEIRFFIALHFLIYMFAVLGLEKFVIFFKKNKCLSILLYFIGLFVYLAYAGSLLATTEAGIAIIHG